MVGTTADFRCFRPPRPLHVNHLLRKDSAAAGRIGEVRLGPPRAVKVCCGWQAVTHREGTAPKLMVQDHAAPPQPKASIICLEGASAAGKTTLSGAIAERTGAGVIGEVWTLFERPSPEPPLWYLERQVDRWRLAVESAAKHGLAILDGDPFQPLWYGWALVSGNFSP